MAPWLFLALALVLLFVEFYLPSGVIATFAGGLFLYSCVDAFLQYGGMGGLLFLIIGLCSGALVVWGALVLIRASSAKNTFFLSSNQEGFVGAEVDASLVGKRGVAASDLGPSGFASIGGKRVHVVSEGRYIEKGANVQVVGCRGATFVVKQSDTKQF